MLRGISQARTSLFSVAESDMAIQATHKCYEYTRDVARDSRRHSKHVYGYIAQ